MNLSQYVTDLCVKLRSNEVVTIETDSIPYRQLMASVLENKLTGPASEVVEGLLGQVISLNDSVTHYRLKLNQMDAELSAAYPNKPKVEVKPKRTIQSAPKRGSIPKEKIEKSLKE